MSPSSNSSLGRLWPDARKRLGVGFDRQGMCAVHVNGAAEGPRVDWMRRRDLPFRVFEGVPPAQAVDALAGAFDDLCAAAKKSFLPVHIALPDPAVSVRVFELDDLPKSRPARARLAQWLLEKELGLRGVECVSQYLGQADKRHLLLVSAVDRRWFNVLEEAWRRAGILPRVVDAAISLTIDRFYAQLAQAEGATALLVMEADCWTLALLDGQNRLRYVRARWRDKSEGTDRRRYQAIVDETERMIMAFAHGTSKIQIGSVFVTGSEDELAQLSPVLDGRMHQPSVPLPLDSGFRRGALDGEDITCAAAVSGAVSR